MGLRLVICLNGLLAFSVPTLAIPNGATTLLECRLDKRTGDATFTGNWQRHQDRDRILSYDVVLYQNQSTKPDGSQGPGSTHVQMGYYFEDSDKNVHRHTQRGPLQNVIVHSFENGMSFSYSPAGGSRPFMITTSTDSMGWRQSQFTYLAKRSGSGADGVGDAQVRRRPSVRIDCLMGIATLQPPKAVDMAGLTPEQASKTILRHRAFVRHGDWGLRREQINPWGEQHIKFKGLNFNDHQTAQHLKRAGEIAAKRYGVQTCEDAQWEASFIGMDERENLLGHGAVVTCANLEKVGEERENYKMVRDRGIYYFFDKKGEAYTSTAKPADSLRYIAKDFRYVRKSK